MARKKTDLSAALTGFILGAVTLFLAVTTIVILTNAKYRNKEAAESAHQQLTAKDTVPGSRYAFSATTKLRARLPLPGNCSE